MSANTKNLLTPSNVQANEKEIARQGNSIPNSGSLLDTWQPQADGRGGYGNQVNSMSDTDNWGVHSGVEITEEQWNRLRSQIRQRWQEVSDEDLLLTQGDFDQLCTLLQYHTGERYEAIAQQLRYMLDREPESEGSARLKAHIM